MDKAKLAKIKEVFEKAPVEVVYLFGSQATGEAGLASDYDFAILNQTRLDKSERLYLSGYLMDKLFVFTGHDKADVVPLEDVSLGTRYLVVSEGKLLLNRNSSRKEAFEQSTRQEFIAQVPKIRESFQKFAQRLNQT